NGEILSAGSSDPRLYLGQLLLARGIIEEDQLLELIKKQEDLKILLGKLIIVEGIADEKIVSEVLVAKITTTVINVFLQKKGIYAFYQNVVSPYLLHMVNVPLIGLIMEGEVKRERWEEIRKTIPTSQALVEAVAPREELMKNEQNFAELKILSLIDGKHSIEDILLETHNTEWDLLSFLYPLQQKGLIRFLEDPLKRQAKLEEIIAEQMLEKSRRLLIAGEFEKAIRSLYRLLQQPDRDWQMALPLILEAEEQYSAWFYANKIASSDVPFLKSSSVRGPGAMDANEAFLLNRIDGIRDVRALLRLSPMREVEVLLALHRFTDAGLIGVRNPRDQQEIVRTQEPPARAPLPKAALEQIFYHLPVGLLT
ncbi:MAG TPA: hypothetical protein VI958_12260, partial [Acidobacteriota bacterium]